MDDAEGRSRRPTEHQWPDVLAPLRVHGVGRDLAAHTGPVGVNPLPRLRHPVPGARRPGSHHPAPDRATPTLPLGRPIAVVRPCITVVGGPSRPLAPPDGVKAGSSDWGWRLSMDWARTASNHCLRRPSGRPSAVAPAPPRPPPSRTLVKTCPSFHSGREMIRSVRMAPPSIGLGDWDAPPGENSPVNNPPNPWLTPPGGRGV